jgi:hypothetical protein
VRKFNVSIVGGIQPEPLLAMASSAEDGLQARFMPFWPEKTKRKLYRGEPLELKGKFALEALSELRMKKDKTTGLWEPVIVPFSDEARTVFADWEDDRKDCWKDARGLARLVMRVSPRRRFRLRLGSGRGSRPRS